jgi:hypothetical protein
MLVFLKNFMQITAFLFLSFTLNIIEWVPSLALENIVNTSIIILFIISVFFVYKTIRITYEQQTKKALWKIVIYTVFLLSYMGGFAILMIGVASGKSTYIESYTFDKKSFYVYENVASFYEVSVKDSTLQIRSLPIRSLPIASFKNKSIVLKKDKEYLYAIGEDIYKKVYNLDKNMKEKYD